MQAPRAVQFRIALATFAILTLELAVIRWSSQQVRAFAYFNNLTLMAAFLGMGLGIALGKRRPELQHWTLPALLLLCAILGFSERLGLVYLRFPDLSLFLWGSERLGTIKTMTLSTLIVLGLFVLIALVFLFAGTIVGHLFTLLPPLKAYSADLIGSFLGVLAMTAVGALGTSPPVWLALGALPLLYFSRRPASILCCAGIIALGWSSAGTAIYSPYYRIDVSHDPRFMDNPLTLAVNRDFHQYAHDLSPAHVESLPPGIRIHMRTLQRAYEVPFRLTASRDRALIVGAGTGNDVAGARRAGFRNVVAVDIDPVIVKIGKAAHPERPYADRGVTPVINDARAYFQQHANERFDVVCFGLLDSHAMFSAMSSLRLENYVYTVESIRSAYAMVKPGGVLTLSFATNAGEWISDRLAAVVWDATGAPPLIVRLPMHSARMYVIGKQISINRVVSAIPFPLMRPTEAVATTRVPTDDWPFLYIRPNTFPLGYLVVIGGLLLVALAGARAVFGAGLFTRDRFDFPLFLMGAAFLLIETRGVVDLSLLFGSTWLVNSAVFAGVLLMAYLANLYVQRFPPRSLTPVFVLLFAALAVNYIVRPGLLLDLPLAARGIIGGLANALPVAFAGVIFSTIFGRSPDPSSSLGSNLLGAVVGGCLEYASIAIGLGALTLVALGLYLGVLFLLLRRGSMVAAPC
jgi:SAM-dependent methyltransferase